MKKLKNLGAAFLYIAIYFIVQFVVFMTFEVFVAISHMQEIIKNGELVYSELYDIVMKSFSENMILLTLISNCVFIATVVLIFVIGKKNFFREVGLLKPDPRFILPVFALGFSVNAIVSLIISIIPFPQSWWDAYNEAAAPFESVTVLMVVAAVIIAPLTEELLFRGLVFTRISRGFGVYVGIVLSSVIFGFLHGTVIWFIYTSLFGILLAFVFVRSRSLVYPILLHLAFNLAGVIFGEKMPIYVIILSFAVFAAALVYFIFLSNKIKLSEATAVAAPATFEQTSDQQLQTGQREQLSEPTPSDDFSDERSDGSPDERNDDKDN